MPLVRVRMTTPSPATPHHTRHHASPRRTGRYARAQLRDGSTLEALCDRLDRVLAHINDCIGLYGEESVMGELDGATPPCAGSCDFNARTSASATARASGAAGAGPSASAGSRATLKPGGGRGG